MQQSPLQLVSEKDSLKTLTKPAITLNGVFLVSFDTRGYNNSWSRRTQAATGCADCRAHTDVPVFRPFEQSSTWRIIASLRIAIVEKVG